MININGVDVLLHQSLVHFQNKHTLDELEWNCQQKFTIQILKTETFADSNIEIIIVLNG